MNVLSIVILALMIASNLLTSTDGRADERNGVRLPSAPKAECANLLKDECDSRVGPVITVPSINAGNFLALLRRGNAYAAEGRYDRALADFDAVIRKGRVTSAPRLVRKEAFYGKGVVFFKTGDCKNASDAFSAAIRLDRGLRAAYHWRAEALLCLGRLNEALSDVNRALWMQPTYAATYTLRARIHGALGLASAAAADSANAAELFLSSTGVVPRSKLYSPSSCVEDDKHLLQVSITRGRVVVEPLYMGNESTISRWHATKAIKIQFGKVGCRIVVEIGASVRRENELSKDTLHTNKTTLTPYTEPPKYEAVFYEKPSTTCSSAKLVIRAYWGYIEMKESALAPDKEPSLDNLFREYDSLFREYGGEGCSIGVRVSKVD